MKLPLDIINKIMIYIHELNHDIMMIQYNVITGKEYYIINNNSKLLKDIELILHKKLNPIYRHSYFDKYNVYKKKYQQLKKKFIF